ncbi:MAG: carbohydrate kinase family protein [Candidatus Peribacteraceae bacterium]
MRFLVHGSIAYDLLLNFDGSFVDGMDTASLQKLSVSYVMPHLKRHHGGTGANIAWNLKLLGHDPMLIGAVGTDGEEYLSLLRSRAIDTTLIDVHPEAITATAIIGTDTSERQIAFFHPGADGLCPLHAAPTHHGAVYGIVSPRNPVRMLEAASALHADSIPFLFDPGQLAHVFSEDEFRRAITQSAGLVVNEYEWELTQKKTGWQEEDVINACGLLVVTLGEKGMRLKSTTEDITVPACKVKKVVNPTGAGDAARAGLLTGLAADWDLQKTGKLAVAIASLVVEQEGTLLDAIDMQTLQERSGTN